MATLDPRVFAAAARAFGRRTFEGATDPITLACSLDPRFVRRKHLAVIADAYARMAKGELDRIAISLPPQVGKSTAGVVWGAFWWLTRNPQARIIIASYADSLAVRHGRAIRALVKEHGDQYGLELDPSSHAANDWSVLTGGGVRSVGVRSGLTGRPGDIIFCDDPHKDRAEADSLAYRRAVHDWWSSTAYSRLAPGAPAVLIQTRWHQDDLVGHVLREEGRDTEGGRWHVLNMPALCTDPDRDPLGRNIGGPLTHPRIGEHESEQLMAHWMDKKRVSTPRDWGALYQGDPQPIEGTLLRGEEMMERRHYGPGKSAIEAKRVAVAIDPSGGGRDTAGVIGGHLGIDERVYITHDKTKVGPADTWSRQACQLAYEIGAEVIVYEKNYGGDMAGKVVRTAWDALAREGAVSGLCPAIKSVVGRRSKLLRAEPIAQAWREDHVRTGAYLPDLESEWCTWQPGSESPGRIDASVYLVLELLPTPGTSAKIGNPVSMAPIVRGGGWSGGR